MNTLQLKFQLENTSNLQNTKNIEKSVKKRIKIYKDQSLSLFYKKSRSTKNHLASPILLPKVLEVNQLYPDSKFSTIREIQNKNKEMLLSVDYSKNTNFSLVLPKINKHQKLALSEVPLIYRSNEIQHKIYNRSILKDHESEKIAKSSKIILTKNKSVQIAKSGKTTSNKFISKFDDLALTGWEGSDIV